MRTLFFKILVAFACASPFMLNAQSPSQAIVINGNLYMAGNFATAARYDLNTNAYSVFDSIPARFASDVIIQNNIAFVAADSLIVRYDIDTYLRTGQVQLNGVRKLAVVGNTLLASTGFGGDSLHLRGFDATTLQPAFSISGISGDCEGIVIHGDSAYVAVPGAWGTPNGKVAVVDLQQQSLVTELDLDTMGRGIDRLYVSGGKIWTVNSIAYANPWGVVSEIDPTTRSITHHSIELNTQHSPGMFQGQLYLRRGSEGVFAFDPTAGVVSDSLVLPGNFVFGAIDTVRQEWLMTETDYFSYGRLYRYDWNGNALDTVEVGISPEALAIDYRSSTGIAEAISIEEIQLWPVPVYDLLHMQWGKVIGNGDVQIFDLNGRVLINQQLMKQSSVSLDVSALPSGVYLLKVNGLAQPLNGRFIK